MFRKKLRELLKTMGLGEIDDEMLDSLQRQLFQFLEFDDSLAGGITFKTGSILTTIQVQNYQEIREKLYYSYRSGEPSERMNLRLVLTSLCLYLTEEQKCQVTTEFCSFQQGSAWYECEIVNSSCERDEDDWK
ncbi:MAG: hypothetical protein ACXAC8_05910 [Candidatus Hodarchaeales archaeon]